MRQGRAGRDRDRQGQAWDSGRQAWWDRTDRPEPGPGQALTGGGRGQAGTGRGQADRHAGTHATHCTVPSYFLPSLPFHTPTLPLLPSLLTCSFYFFTAFLFFKPSTFSFPTTICKASLLLFLKFQGYYVANKNKQENILTATNNKLLLSLENFLSYMSQTNSLAYTCLPPLHRNKFYLPD